MLVGLRKAGDVLGKLRHRGGGLAGQHGPALRRRVIGGDAQVRCRQEQVERGPFFAGGVRHAHMGGGVRVQAGAENPVKEGIGLGVGGAEVTHKRVIDPNREAFLGGAGTEFRGEITAFRGGGLEQFAENFWRNIPDGQIMDHAKTVVGDHVGGGIQRSHWGLSIQDNSNTIF